MTANRNFKRRVRARAGRTGESYQAARQRLLVQAKEPTNVTETNPTELPVRVAMHSMPLGPSLPTAPDLEAQGDKIAAGIAASAAGGATIAFFPEGALISPHKNLISRSAPELDESDWTKIDWPALRGQLTRLAAEARRHRVGAVFGALHDLGPNRRPHNCLYVIDANGQVVTRYDKRRLSTTEITYMYTPGTEPVLVELAGLRIGLVLGLEVLFPDYFTSYADRGADLIVAASHGGGIFEQLISSYAMINTVPTALVIPPLDADRSHTGLYGLHGPIATAEDSSSESIVFADVPRRDRTPSFNFKARHGFYDDHLLPSEPRSLVRDEF